jgi:hypothetical protein
VGCWALSKPLQRLLPRRRRLMPHLTAGGSRASSPCQPIGRWGHLGQWEHRRHAPVRRRQPRLRGPHGTLEAPRTRPAARTRPPRPLPAPRPPGAPPTAPLARMEGGLHRRARRLFPLAGDPQPPPGCSSRGRVPPGGPRSLPGYAKGHPPRRSRRSRRLPGSDRKGVANSDPAAAGVRRQLARPPVTGCSPREPTAPSPVATPWEAPVRSKGWGQRPGRTGLPPSSRTRPRHRPRRRHSPRCHAHHR